MEALGVVANISAVIDISTKTIALCAKYAQSVKNEQSDKVRLLRKVTLLYATCQKARDLFQGEHGAKLAGSGEIVRSIRRARFQLQRLENGLNTQRRTIFGTLVWPFKKADVEQVIEDLTSCQETISAFLQIDQTSLLLGLDQRDTIGRLPIAEGAMFNTQRQENDPKCLPGTRVDLLRQINEWAIDPQGKPIFWLNGMAGTGKSTISRTVCEHFTANTSLGASFFFKRGEADRVGLKRFFATIAAGLIENIPALSSHIKEVIDSDLKLFEKPSREQFEKLIVQPLDKPHHHIASRSLNIIVIDALDECENEDDVKLLIYLMSRIDEIKSVRLRVFITSRPELPIRLGFRQVSDKHQDLILHDVPEPVIEHDISIFYKHELAIIRNLYNMGVPEELQLPEDWPSRKNLQLLVDMAIPLFIAAATACRFISDRSRRSPDTGLRRILQQRSSKHHFSDLYAMYDMVLTQMISDRSDEKDDILNDFRFIVGSIVVLTRPFSLNELARMLDISVITIHDTLSSLYALLNINPSPDSPIRLLHLSFRDFLVAPDNCGKTPFWIDELKLNRQMARHCLRILNKSLRQDICGLGEPGASRFCLDHQSISRHLPAEVEYACTHWVYHLQQAQLFFGDDQDNEGLDIYGFLRHHVLHWLEALCLLGNIYDGIEFMDNLEGIVKNESRIKAFVIDTKRLILAFSTAIDDAPLQLYVSASLFTPENSVIRRELQLNTSCPSWLLLPPKRDLNWEAFLLSLEGHDEGILQVVLSPDTSLVATCDFKGTAKIWNSNTGRCLQTIHFKNRGGITMALSHDNRWIATWFCCVITVWDTRTGQHLQTFEELKHYLERTPDIDTTSFFREILYSHDSKKLATTSAAGTLSIIDVVSGQGWTIFIDTSEYSDDMTFTGSIAFSHDSQRIAAVIIPEIAQMWDTATGQELQTFTHDATIRSVAFSHDSKNIVSVSSDGAVKLWNSQTGYLLWAWTLDTGFGAAVFSKDSQRIVATAFDEILTWDVTTKEIVNTISTRRYSESPQLTHSPEKFFLRGNSNAVKVLNASQDHSKWDFDHNGAVTCVAFSKDSKKFVSGSDDATLKIWDSMSGLCLHTLQGHTEVVHTVTWSPDSKHVISGSADRGVRIWDATTGRLVHILTDHESAIHIVKCAPGSETIATVGRWLGDKVRLWNSTTGQCTNVINHCTYKNIGIDGGLAGSIAFSLDSKQVATTISGRVFIWDTSTEKCQCKKIIYKSYMERRMCVWECVAFTPDGNAIAMIGNEGTVFLHDVESGAFVGKIGLITEFSHGYLLFDYFTSDLRTSYGIFQLQSLPGSLSGDGLGSWVNKKFRRHGLGVNGSWIMRGSKRLLWLPPELRPDSLDQALEVSETALAIGCQSGRVLFMRFSEDEDQDEENEEWQDSLTSEEDSGDDYDESEEEDWDEEDEEEEDWDEEE